MESLIERRMTNGSDLAYSVTVDSTDYIYITGVSGVNNSDWWVKNFDVNGNEILTGWDKTFHGGFWDDSATAIATDKNNNVYIAGKKATGGVDTAL
jgi:hypothetical protein